MFAGIGGFRSGLTRAGGFRCVGHCEIDKYANASYLAYSQADRRERYVREEQFSGKLLSLEQMAENDLLSDYVGAEAAPSAEEEALEREQAQSLAERKEMLLLAMLSLNDADRELINALFFDGASTRDYAARIGITQRAVIKRRDRILRDLKKYFEIFSN